MIAGGGSTECTKFVFGRGSATDPAWGGAYSTPLDCLSVLLSGREGEGTHIPGSAPERRIADSAPNTPCRNDSSSLGARRLEYKAVFDLPNRDSGWIQ